MKIILEIIPHTDSEHVTHRVIEQFPATIGRGFHNDIILTDPHVSAQHLRLESNGVSWAIIDLGSTNGLYINAAERPPGQAHTVISGDVLRVGQTELRVYAPHHAVAAALRMQKSHPVFSWLSHPLNVWACFLLAIAVTQFWSFMEIWTEEPGMVLAAAGACTTGIILLWATLWSAGGRLVNHKPHFKSHAALICLYLVASTAGWYIESYTDYLTNENWLSTVISYGINFFMLAVLLYGSFTLSSRMQLKQRLNFSALLSASAMAVLFALSMIAAKTFNQQPIYPSTLKPYLSWLAPTDTIDEFMAGNEKIFASKEFARDAASKKPQRPKSKRPGL